MKQTTIKISESVLDDLAILQKLYGLNSIADTIGTMTHNTLRETHAYTQDGYLPVGTVVQDGKRVMVIEKIADDRVYFDSGTSEYNGVCGTYRLKFLANSLEEYNKVEQREN